MDVCSWPTDGIPPPLLACPKPAAQGIAPKVSFTVLRSQVARPGFGQLQSFTITHQRTASRGIAAVDRSYTYYRQKQPFRTEYF